MCVVEHGTAVFLEDSVIKSSFSGLMHKTCLKHAHVIENKPLNCHLHSMHINCT